MLATSRKMRAPSLQHCACLPAATYRRRRQSRRGGRLRQYIESPTLSSRSERTPLYTSSGKKEQQESRQVTLYKEGQDLLSYLLYEAYYTMSTILYVRRAAEKGLGVGTARQDSFRELGTRQREGTVRLFVQSGVQHITPPFPLATTSLSSRRRCVSSLYFVFRIVSCSWSHLDLRYTRMYCISMYVYCMLRQKFR